MSVKIGRLIGYGFVALGLAACREQAPSQNLAPAATALASAKPASAESQKFTLDPAGSQVTFAMSAPLENIYGQVDQASGELYIDPKNLKESRGLISVDLSRLELLQETRKDEKGSFAPRTKSDMQNQHARAWLEISDDAPEAERKKNQRVEFKITQVISVSEADLSRLAGEHREVTAEVKGEMLIHQRKSERTAKLKLVFDTAGDKVTGITVTTAEPFTVSLEQHDVRPRDAFGKLAERTLESVGQKVNKEPAVSLTFHAIPAEAH